MNNFQIIKPGEESCEISETIYEYIMIKDKYIILDKNVASNVHVNVNI